MTAKVITIFTYLCHNFIIFNICVCLILHYVMLVLKGIIVEAYAPLGSPGRWGVSESEPVVMDDPLINEIAAKKGATAAQVCI